MFADSHPERDELHSAPVRAVTLMINHPSAPKLPATHRPAGPPYFTFYLKHHQNTHRPLRDYNTFIDRETISQQSGQKCECICFLRYDLFLIEMFRAS